MRRLVLGVLVAHSLAGSASAQYLKARVGRYISNIAGTQWVNVEGASIGWTPAAASDIWIVLLSGRLHSSGTGQNEAEIRYTVNGTVRGVGAIQNSAANKGASWQHFYAITGTTLRQDIQVQFRDAAGPNQVTVEDLIVIAFKLPAGADFHYAENAANVPVSGPGWASYLSLNVNPSSAGDYLIFALANGSEAPSINGLHWRLRDPGAVSWPIDDDPGSPDRFALNDRGQLWSLFLARRQNLAPGANPYTIEARSGDAVNAQMQYQRLMAFRTDAFDAYQGTENIGATPTASTSPVVVSALTTAAPPAARDYVIIQSLYLGAPSSTTDERRAGFEHDNVVRSSYAHVLDTAAQRVPYAHFDAKTTALSVLYENAFSSSSGLYTVTAKESVIHVLRLSTADPAAAIGLEAFGAKDTPTGGPGWSDFNNDGCLDLLVGSFDRVIGSTLLMQNESGGVCLGTFRDVTDCLVPGARSINGERHSIWGDVNNDGLPDFARNQSTVIEIYLNNGFDPAPPAGCPNWQRFGSAGNPSQSLDATSVAPEFTGMNSEALAFIDFDRDGVLELVSNMHDEGMVIFENNGSGVFSKVIVPGLPTSGTISGDFGAATDIDGDGDVDIFQRIEVGVDIYWNNNNGTFSAGTFDQVADNANKGGVAFCDFDNDGDFDLFWTEAGTNQVWEQTGVRSGNFVARGVPTVFSGRVDGVACGDIDNDGDVDLALTSSANDHLFRNDGGFTFTDVTPSFFGTNEGHGAAFADFDRDGDVDLVIQQDGNLFLWRNPTNNNNYLIVRALQDVDGVPGGTTRDAIGATVELLSCSGAVVSGIREVQGGHGHGSQDSPFVHFGLPTSGTPSGAAGEYGVRVKFLDGNIVGKAVVPSSLGSYQLLTVRSTDADDTSACTTAVKLSSLEAKGVAGGIEVSWETASELDNLGFHLHRAPESEGRYERITMAPIPGLGSSPRGARYRYVDSGLTPGERFFYKLEDIETTGRTKLHGPVTARALEGSPTAPDGAARLRYGSPEKNGLEIRKSGTGIELVLTTEGFEALAHPDGSVDLDASGLTVLHGESVPRLRTWVDLDSCRDPRLASVRRAGLERFSLRPVEAVALHEASPRGSVRAGRGARRARESAADAGSARILEVGYQRDARKALVEISPFHWDGARSQLELAREVVVRIVQTRSRDCSARSRRTSSSHRAGVFARLVTYERGLYGVDVSELSSRGKAVSLDRLRLTRLGMPVPFHVEGSTLYFFSEGGKSNPYGHDAVFELSLGGNGLKMNVPKGAPHGTGAPIFSARSEHEENRFYQAGLLEAPDVWLWDMLFAPVTRTFPFTLELLAPSREPARLVVELQGTSDFAANPDHHVRIYLNDVLVGEDSWDGRTARTLTVPLPQGILHDGENRLAIENVGDTGAPYSMVMLNRFVIFHSRFPAGEIEGTAEGNGSIPGAGVLDVTDPGAVGWVAPSNGRFPVEEGRSYFVAGEVRRPQVRRPPPATLARGGADYLLIAPEAFLKEAEPLLAHRRRQGLRARAVAIEDVFSEFGYGESRPEAIRDFLSHAYFQWDSPAPRYVVLLGDATYDFKDYLGTGVENHVPPLLVKTPYLWTASDPGYAMIHGEDSLPDLAIGRLPAATAEQARAMVGKLLEFEMRVPRPSPVVLVADNADSAGDFPAEAEAIAAGLLSRRDVRRIVLGPMAPSEVKRGTIAAFDEGASLLSYLGHGGIHLWADENVFDLGDVDRLAPQDQLPILLTMNCLNGYFHFPYFDSLAEALVKKAGRGAIAAIAPSGLSLHRETTKLHRSLLDELENGGHDRLGDAWLAAQARYASGGETFDHLHIYHLLGDPALRLR